MVPDLSLPRAFGPLVARGRLKCEPGDFRVTEQLGFSPRGHGEHAWLFIEKCDANTRYVADGLARFFAVPTHSVGYAGMKDRRAITRQWFSVHLPGQAVPSLHNLQEALECDVRVLLATRSLRKLRAGAHQGNWFDIRLRDFHCDALRTLTAQLEAIARIGFPNAFGSQRFGHAGANLRTAQYWFEEGRRPRARHVRSLTLSAARAHIFNEVVRARVAAQTWADCLVGEWSASNADGSRMPTGPLAGRGQSNAQGLPLAIERTVLSKHEAWVEGLEKAGLKLERRRLVAEPQGLRWDYDAGQKLLRIRFALRSGEFATTLLGQFCELHEPAPPDPRKD